MGVDSTGYIKGFQVYYNFRIGPDSSFHSDVLTDPNFRLHTPATAYDAQQWRFNIPLGKPQTVVVNGLTWRHVLFYGFDSYSPDPSKPGIPAPKWGGQILPYPVVKTKQPEALSWVGEAYTLQLDKSHEMKIWAQYERPVVQDAHWFNVRRAMLRELVDAVTVTPLTPSLLHELALQYQAQRVCERTGNAEACKKGHLEVPKYPGE